MAKKPTKSSLTRKLDSICSRIVRSTGQCNFCGLADFSKLQCAHIFSRTYRSTRWDLENLLCLCAKCHMYGHSNPIWFTEKTIQHLGEVKFLRLKQSHIAITKTTIDGMMELLKSLEELEQNLWTQGYGEKQ